MVTIDANNAVIAPVMIRMAIAEIRKNIGDKANDCVVSMHPEQEAQWENVGIRVTSIVEGKALSKVPLMPHAVTMGGLPINIELLMSPDKIIFSYEGKAIAQIVHLGTWNEFRA